MTAVKASRLVNRTSKSLALSRLDQKGLTLYAFLLRRIGYKATPLPVATSYMAKGCGMTARQVGYRISKMVELKLIEKWTVKHPTHYKKTFYRLVFSGDRRALYKEKARLLRSDSMGTSNDPSS